MGSGPLQRRGTRVGSSHGPEPCREPERLRRGPGPGPHLRRQPPAPEPRRVRRTTLRGGQPEPRHPGGGRPGRGGGSHPPLRAARAREDDPRPPRGDRGRRQPARGGGPHPAACGGPRRPAHAPGEGRRALHRRGPPSARRRGGVPLRRDGGLRPRHHARRGPGGPERPGGSPKVHAGRRHHARGAAVRPVPESLRHPRAPRDLRRARPRAHRAPLRAHSRRGRRRGGGADCWPSARGARPAW